jgi:hypothetical protein
VSARYTTLDARCGVFVAILNQLACVPAFIADDQASDTKGFELAKAVWTRFGQGGQGFWPDGGPWGVGAAPIHA